MARPPNVLTWRGTPPAGWHTAPRAAEPAIHRAHGSSPPNQQRIALIGEPGAARAVFADWLRRRTDDPLVIAAGIDVALAERPPEVVLYRLGEAIARATGLPDGLPLGIDPLTAALPAWLAKAGAGGGTVLYLEGVDRRGDPLGWLPDYLPPTVSVVVTTGPGETAESLEAGGWQPVALGGTDEPAVPPESATTLLARLWASPEGLDDARLEQIDPGGEQRRAARSWLRRRPGGVTLRDEGARTAIEKHLLADRADRETWLTRLAADADDPVAASAWLLEAHAWHALAERLATPEMMDYWAEAAPALVWMWRGLPVLETALDTLLSALAARRRAAPDAPAAHRHLAAIDLLTALERDTDAAALRAEALQWVANHGEPAAVLAELLHRDGLAALEAGEPAAATQRLEQALRLRHRLFGASAPETRSTEHALTMVLESGGDLETAIDRYRQTLATAMERHGGSHPRLIAHLANLAGAQRAANTLDAARDNLNAALEIARDRLGTEHPTTASLQDSLAGLLYAGGDLEGAERAYREAAETTQRLFGPTHPATAAALHNLGTCLDSAGAYREAEDCFRRALAVRRATGGDYHEDTASTLHNLAGVLEVTGRADEAEALYRDAIGAWELVVGPEHPATATSINNLADLLRDAGRFDEAEPLYRRNLRTWQRLYGADHPNTLMTAAELGALYADAGRAAEAERLLNPTVDSLRARLGITSGLYVDAALRLARLRADQGRRDEALALLDETLGAAEGSTAILGARYQKLRRHRDAIAGKHGGGVV